MIDKKGIITIPKPTKVQMAFAIYWNWIHEVQFELAENPHPSWNGYTVKQFKRIRDLKSQMTDAEKQQLSKMMHPSKIK